jgi:hypothetical protein
MFTVFLANRRDMNGGILTTIVFVKPLSNLNEVGEAAVFKKL